MPFLDGFDALGAVIRAGTGGFGEEGFEGVGEGIEDGEVEKRVVRGIAIHFSARFMA